MEKPPMKIEHVGLNVKDPVGMADWWVKNLGMKVVRKFGPPACTHFLADASGQVMVEIYCNTKAAIPDYASMDLLVLHVAFVSGDIGRDHDRLVEAGATELQAPYSTEAGDRIAVVRDPWGFPVQLVERAQPMI
jgi:catechol 2,3-dioxygenase-like lactoylglutathione lyase family enzyme